MPTEALRAVWRSKIAIGTSSGPEWLNELKVRITREGSTKMAKHTTICAGIDTGKRKLDVAIEGRRELLQVDNTAEGHKVLLAWLRQRRVKRVGIEASGGYEQPVVAELRRKRFVVVVFQPAQVRAYAKFHLQRAKNDKIDAALIAACTAAVRKIHAAPDPRLLPFAEQLTMIDQINEDTARLKNRIESCSANGSNRGSGAAWIFRTAAVQAAMRAASILSFLARCEWNIHAAPDPRLLP